MKDITKLLIVVAALIAITGNNGWGGLIFIALLVEFLL